MDYLIISPDGDIKDVSNGSLTHQQMHDIVNADLELLQAPPDLDVSVFAAESKVNDAGDRLHLNSRVTSLLVDVMWPGDNVVGTVIITGPVDAEGESTSLDEVTKHAVAERLHGRGTERVVRS